MGSLQGTLGDEAVWGVERGCRPPGVCPSVGSIGWDSQKGVWGAEGQEEWSHRAHAWVGVVLEPWALSG